MKITGSFGLDVYSEQGVLIASQRFNNGLTLVGVNDLWDIYFRNGSTASAWYIGLIDNSGFTAVADDTDTMSSHSGWTEFTSYDESTRAAWSPDAASGQSINNATLGTVAINAAGTIKGLFVTSDNTKSGTSGILWNTGITTTTQSFQPGQTAKLSYELIGQEG